MRYQQFIENKFRRSECQGIDPSRLNTDGLFPHQEALTRWALRKGRAAVFADTGLGKSRIQIAWAEAIARHIGSDVLILCPLAVAEQTRQEAEAMGVMITHARDGADVRPGINITNYDRMHRFDARRFVAVALDESSLIKHHESKTRELLMATFHNTPYRLCLTATPAPNDWTELGTHAEFLGICSRSEMLAEYFMHDGGETQTWRLKGHARGPFWRWVATWAALIRNPEDLGFDGSAYYLPPMHIEQITTQSDQVIPDGHLFALEAQTLNDRRAARRASMRYRVEACADLANSIDEPWIIWCELNAEAEAVCAAIPGAVEIRGSDTTDYKEHALGEFASGRIRVLVTKPKIAGFGLNWQHCRRIGFLGVTDSWESYYQAVRRCWRFGQKRDVYVYVFASQEEGAVRANLERKEQQAEAMFAQLSRETCLEMRKSVMGQASVSNPYQPNQSIQIPDFLRTAA